MEGPFSILRYQYNDRWWPGDATIQGMILNWGGGY